MARMRRLSPRLDNLTSHISRRIDAGLRRARGWRASLSVSSLRGSLGRRSMIYAAVALALAGVAGVTVAGVSGGPASTPGAQYAVNRAGQAHMPEGSTAKRGPTQPGHGQLPARDRLTPVGTSGPQSSMPITPARYKNAQTIVRQAVDKHMGVRSAVIAVATAMQESTLLNLSYGDRDSVGLFQQRPSAGWGTSSQIQHPAYAADAFFGALRAYQAQDPGWANQPLWETAQGVQQSAFPSAYAKWEAQAARVVAAVDKHLTGHKPGHKH